MAPTVVSLRRPTPDSSSPHPRPPTGCRSTVSAGATPRRTRRSTGRRPRLSDAGGDLGDATGRICRPAAHGGGVQTGATAVMHCASRRLRAAGRSCSALRLGATRTIGAPRQSSKRRRRATPRSTPPGWSSRAVRQRTRRHRKNHVFLRRSHRGPALRRQAGAPFDLEQHRAPGVHGDGGGIAEVRYDAMSRLRQIGFGEDGRMISHTIHSPVSTR